MHNSGWQFEANRGGHTSMFEYKPDAGSGCFVFVCVCVCMCVLIRAPFR